MEERRRVREERERHDAATRGREKEKARGWERERKRTTGRETQHARRAPCKHCLELSPLCRLNLTGYGRGFQRRCSRFEHPSFHHDTPPTPCPLSPTPLVSLLSFLRAFARPCSTSETNGRRATARALSGRQPNFPWLSFLPGRTELLKSFDGPSDSWIYIARLMHVAVGEVGRGKRYAGGGGEIRGKLVEL